MTITALGDSPSETCGVWVEKPPDGIAFIYGVTEAERPDNNEGDVSPAFLRFRVDEGTAILDQPRVKQLVLTLDEWLARQPGQS